MDLDSKECESTRNTELTWTHTLFVIFYSIEIFIYIYHVQTEMIYVIKETVKT